MALLECALEGIPRGYHHHLQLVFSLVSAFEMLAVLLSTAASNIAPSVRALVLAPAMALALAPVLMLALVLVLIPRHVFR